MEQKNVGKIIEITTLWDYDRKELYEVKDYLIEKAGEILGGSIGAYAVLKQEKEDFLAVRNKTIEIFKANLILFTYNEMLKKYSLDKLSTPLYAELIAAVINKLIDVQKESFEAIDKDDKIDCLNLNISVIVKRFSKCK